MLLQSIDINNFRLLKAQRVKFGHRVTFITGKNGQGKTSLLEAIYVLSQAKSFRTGHIKDAISWKHEDSANLEGFFLEGRFLTAEGQKTIGYEFNQGKRHIRINNKLIAEPEQFYGAFQALEISPSDADIIVGASSSRRKFIDRLLSMVDKSFVHNLIAYQRALKNRNLILLEAIKQGTAAKASTIEKLNVWDVSLASYGLTVAAKRSELVKTLEPLFCYYYNALLQFSNSSNSEKVALTYKTKAAKKGNIISETEYLESLSSNILNDTRYKTTTFGIHRDDVLILIDCGFGFKEAKIAASQGQTKSLALALKLAATEFLKQTNPDEELPVLLLDDIESELDSLRKQSLFDLVRSVKNQVIIATTEVSSSIKDRLDDYEIKVIEQGRIIS